MLITRLTKHKVTDFLEQPCDKTDNTMQQHCYKLLRACSELVDNLQQDVEPELVDSLFADSL